MKKKYNGSENVTFISLRTQFENVGDALINRELIKLIAARSRVVVEIGNAPQHFLDAAIPLHIGVETIKGKRLFLQRILVERLAGKRVYIFFTPGAKLGEITVNQLARRLIAVMPFGMAKLTGVKLCCVGISVENIGKNHGRYLRVFGGLIDYLYVRDNESKAVLRDLGVKRVCVLPDLSFNIFDGVGLSKNYSRPRKVCFSFRIDQYDSQLADCYSILSRVIGRLPKNTRYYISAQVERDVKAVRLLKAKVRNQLGIDLISFVETKSIDSLKDKYSSIDCVVSNRLHVLLLAASCHTNVIACSSKYNKKITGLFQTINRNDLVIDEKFSNEEFQKALLGQPISGKKEKNGLRLGFNEIYRSII